MITAETLRKFAPKMKDPAIHASALEDARQTSLVRCYRCASQIIVYRVRQQATGADCGVALMVVSHTARRSGEKG
jgi:hypothetical protein